MKADRSVKGVIFNIQKFSVNDGPGIRTVVFFKGCPLRCAWCANPESQLAKVQVLWDQKKCIGCHHCLNICPEHAISLQNGRIHIDHKKCSSCLKCASECPGHALQKEGETKTVQEVLDVVMQDEVFYEESGGGITLSGGEMLMQPEFACQLLKAAKEEGLHTCCETTGFANEEVFTKVMENIDEILFDMKHWDPLKHKEGTGVTNERILANMALAVKQGKSVLPRIPVIPGYNDSLKDAAEMAERLKTAGLTKCQLLPFHQFGENKYHLLDQTYQYEDKEALHREDLQEYLREFTSHGVDAFF